MTSWLISYVFHLSQIGFFKTTHKVYTQAPTEPKCSLDMMQCNCRAENTRNVGIHSRKRPKAQVSPFTISRLTLLWLTRGRATELARRLWEKDKRPAESIEIGAPVFITLVYRLNSHLLSPSAKCPLDLLFSCLHLKQFIKNEWGEGKTPRGCEMRGSRRQKEKKDSSLNTGEDWMTELFKMMFSSASILN